MRLPLRHAACTGATVSVALLLAISKMKILVGAEEMQRMMVQAIAVAKRLE
jgi:hypothetical protein